MIISSLTSEENLVFDIALNLSYFDLDNDNIISSLELSRIFKKYDYANINLNNLFEQLANKTSFVQTFIVDGKLVEKSTIGIECTYYENTKLCHININSSFLKLVQKSILHNFHYYLYKIIKETCVDNQFKSDFLFSSYSPYSDNDDYIQLTLMEECLKRGIDYNKELLQYLQTVPCTEFLELLNKKIGKRKAKNEKLYFTSKPY